MVGLLISQVLAGTAALLAGGAANAWNPVGWGLLAAGAISGGYQMYQGFKEKKEGRELSEQYNLKDRPRAEMSEGMNDYVSLQERLAGSQMPGQDAMAGEIRQSTAQGLSGVRQLASSEGSAMSGMLGMLDQERRSMRSLGAQALQWQSGQQQQLGQAYLQQGQAQDRLWETNEYLPWQMGMNQAEALRSSGQQNIYGGLDQIGASAIQGANINATNQMYGNMMDTWGSTGNGTIPYPANNGPVAPNPWANQQNMPISGQSYNYNYNQGFR